LHDSLADVSLRHAAHGSRK